MFWRMLSGSLRHQYARLAVAMLAMALGSTLVSGLLNLSGDISGQVGQRLRDYGANIIIRPAGQVSAGGSEMPLGNPAAAPTMAESDLARAKEVAGVISVVPYLHALVEASGRPVILAGVDVLAARSLNGWWRVEGRWPEANDEVLAGIRAVAALELAPGNTFQVEYGDAVQTLRVVGTLDTGGAEDDQLIVGLPAVQTLVGQPGQVGVAMVSALTSEQPLAIVVDELEALLPGIEVRPLAQLVRAEARVLDKVRTLMGLVAMLVLITGALTLAGTLNTIVIERRGEIGLMKALGATDRRVASLFLAEALSVGAIGGVAGYLVGLALAMGISTRVFEAAITPTIWGLPGTLTVGLTVALMAGFFPVRGALRVDPIKTLRGE